MTTSQNPPEYALRIGDREVERFRMMATRAIEREGDIMRRAGVVPGARIVDVGCGPGAMTVELARITGGDGEVVGVEPDPASRAIAERSTSQAGVPWARVIDGRGDATGLPESSWDVVMIRHVLFHVGGMAAAVVEHAAALVRPGGCVYLVDTINSGTVVAPVGEGDDDHMRRYRDFQRARGNDPDIGARLHALLIAAGLDLVDHEGSYTIVPGSVLLMGGPLVAAQEAMLAAGAITAEEAAQSAQVRQRLAADPAVRLFVPHIVAVGRRR